MNRIWLFKKNKTTHGKLSSSMKGCKKKKKKKAAKKKKGGFQIEILPTDTILLCKNLSYREGMYF